MGSARVTSPCSTGWLDRLQLRITQAGQWSGPMALSCTIQVGRIDYNPVSYRPANGRAQVTSPDCTGWPDRLHPRTIQAGQWSGPMALPCTIQVGRIDYTPVSYRPANGVGLWHFP